MNRNPNRTKFGLSELGQVLTRFSLVHKLRESYRLVWLHFILEPKQTKLAELHRN